jgi:hypothetical protein
MIARCFYSLFKQIPEKVGQASGDGAYDTKACYQSIAQRGAKATIPPWTNREKEAVWCNNSSDRLAIREATLHQIHQ